LPSKLKLEAATAKWAENKASLAAKDALVAAVAQIEKPKRAA
jgi:hypothetical protein